MWIRVLQEMVKVMETIDSEIWGKLRVDTEDRQIMYNCATAILTLVKEAERKGRRYQLGDLFDDLPLGETVEKAVGHKRVRRVWVPSFFSVPIIKWAIHYLVGRSHSRYTRRIVVTQDKPDGLRYLRHQVIG